jgi:hypothetical protein
MYGGSPESVGRHRKVLYQFWIPLMIGILDFSFILDFLCVIFTGSTLAEVAVGTDNPITKAVASNLPVDPLWLMICAAGVMAFLAVILYGMIWLAFYDYRGRKMERMS